MAGVHKLRRTRWSVTCTWKDIDLEYEFQPKRGPSGAFGANTACRRSLDPFMLFGGRELGSRFHGARKTAGSER